MNAVKSIIVVADTHFGLRGKMSCEPVAFYSFLNWLKRLEKKRREPLNMGKWGVHRSRTLVPPDKIILLGDILELWDATNRCIDASTRAIIQLISELKCEKIYLLGNHDRDLIEVLDERKGEYPLGASKLLIFDEHYPIEAVPGSGTEALPLKIGDRGYLFLHGHQFDKLFALPSWQLMAPIRTAALAFGLYSWVFTALFISALVLGYPSYGGFIGILFVTLLGSLSIPFLIIQFGRKIWNKLKTTKYDREGALRGFVKWWKKHFKSRKLPKAGLCVIYGHTHLADMFSGMHLSNAVKKAVGKPFEEKNLVLLNVPSWVKDQAEKRVDELRGIFLYIDNQGEEFVGWDWDAQRPFLVPKELILKRRSGEALTKPEATELTKINWPQKLIEEWKKPLAT